MQEDRAWDRITDAIDMKFGIDKHGKLERKLPDAMHLTEEIRFVEFARAGERYRLERSTGPAIIDRRTVGARRAGSEITFENVYDPTEIGHKTSVFKQDGSDWTPISMEALELS